jgi:hypothetical protein
MGLSVHQKSILKGVDGISLETSKDVCVDKRLKGVV